MRRVRAALGVVAVTCMVAVAGCGPSGDGTADAEATCVSPGVTSGEVKLGLILPDTGSSASVLRAARSGVDARLGAANAGGGVHGRAVTYAWRDDESDPAANLHGAQELVEGEKVFGLIEMTTVASGSAGYLGDVGVPVAGLAMEPVWSDHRNMFSAQNVVSGGGPGVDTWGRYVAAQGGSKAVVVEAQISQTSHNVATALGASLAAAGTEIVDTVDYTPGFSNPRQVAARFIAAGADTLTGALPAVNFAEILAELHAQGAPVRVALSATGYDQSVLAEFGSRIAGESLFVSYQPFERDLPAHRAFLDSMVRYAPELAPASDQMAVSAYIATDLMLRGLEAAGACPTRDGFIAALRDVDDFTGTGLLPREIDLTESFGLPNTCYFFLRVNEAGTEFQTAEPAPMCGAPLAAPNAG